MNNFNPLFSVLIANYNNGRYIAEAIESILAQDYKNWEIIIVDDASTDTSISIINHYIDKGINIVLEVNEINMGAGYTKGRCAMLAKGEIAGYLDPDDALLKNAISIMVKKHSENQEFVLINSNAFHCDKDLNIKLEKKLLLPPRGKYLMEMQDQKYGVSHFTTFKLDKYRQTEGLNPLYRRAIDQNLYYLLEEIGTMYHLDMPLYKYRIHKDGISLGANNLKAIGWHCVIIYDTCKRRKWDIEKYVPAFLQKTFIDIGIYRVGSILLKPYNYIKAYFGIKYK